MMAITTRSSIRVNPRGTFVVLISDLLSEKKKLT
jgi:hypothetical protein